MGRGRKWRQVLAGAAAWACLAAGIVSAGEIDPALQNRLAGAGPNDRVPVILFLSHPSIPPPVPTVQRTSARAALIRGLRTQADTAQKTLREWLISRGIPQFRPLWLVNGLAVEVPAGLIPALAGRAEVKEIRLDGVVPLAAGPSTGPGSTVDGWNLAVLGVPDLWAEGVDGTGVVVATLDTGADLLHPDLAGRWRGGGNSWFDPNGQHATPYDRSGHGTQVLGLLVGGSAGGGPIGVAPGARWIAAKIFNDAGVATYSGIHQAYQWLLDPDGDPDTDDAPDIVNNSWSLQGSVNQCVAEFHDDLAVLRAAGIGVVFAAGNDGPGAGSSASPANDPASLAVGALTEGLTPALFSSRGPATCDGRIWPAVAAPGVNVRTADLTLGGVFPSAYADVSGTSFAAPQIAGGLALLRQAFPLAAAADLEAALAQTASDLEAPGPDNDTGAGLPDLLAAYALLLNEFTNADRDHDGYYAGPAGGTLADCNDDDPAIHPGAAEIKHDGIDQDCNGYDLTIDILQAVYRPADDILKVTAVSTLLAEGKIKGSGLELAGFGPMTRRNVKGRTWWEITVKYAGGNPGTVVVSGVEGATAAPTTIQ
jgi:serine protease AprX